MIRRLVKTVFSGNYKGHFGQWAEDVLVRKLFPKNKNNGVYLDIGAYHPFCHSNTAYFWLKGWRGFNIDANPKTIRLFNQIRPADKNIWAAVIPELDYLHGVREIKLMLPNNSTTKCEISGFGTCNIDLGSARGLTKQLSVPAKSISQIITDNNIDKLDYLNIDIEGSDEQIIKDFNFSLLRPTVITIEDYSENIEKLILSNISNKLFSHGYDLVGRAGPTSVFTSIK